MSHIGERLCFPQPKTVVSSPTFTLKLPCLYMCTNRRLRFLPISKLNFCTATLILLAGDGSLNPGPSGSDFIRMATLNVRFLTSKCASFSDLVLSKKLDVVAITETWLSPKESSPGLADLRFKLIHQPRQGKTSGGVAIMVVDQLNVTRCEISQLSCFEAMCCKITSSSFWHKSSVYTDSRAILHYSLNNDKISWKTCHLFQENCLSWAILIYI